MVVPYGTSWFLSNPWLSDKLQGTTRQPDNPWLSNKLPQSEGSYADISAEKISSFEEGSNAKTSHDFLLSTEGPS